MTTKTKTNIKEDKCTKKNIKDDKCIRKKVEDDKYSFRNVVNYFNTIKSNRQRKAIPTKVIKKAITEVNKIKKIPFSTASYPDLYWGKNPYLGNPVAINLPVISKKKLIDVPEDFRDKPVFYDKKKAKSQNIKFKKDSCIVEHNGEVMIVYVTEKTDRAITKATERIPSLIKKIEKYYPVKAQTFYTPYTLIKGGGTAEQKLQFYRELKKAQNDARYTGKNWMDGMIYYFCGCKNTKGAVYITYQPRNPDADNDEEFLFDLIYTYMALYELEKRYAPDVAKYRYELAKNSGFPGAFPGVPLKYHCSTGVGASMDFASSIHNDSGMSGLTETIIWTKPKKGSEQYFISPTIKMAFDLTNERAIILQPPRIPHSTVQTGNHQGV